MQFTQLLSMVLGLAVLSSALPSGPLRMPIRPKSVSSVLPSGPLRMPIRPKSISSRRLGVKHALSKVEGIDAIPIKDFLITNLSSSIEPTHETWDLLVSFIFTDLNSNTSTSCSQAWPQTNGTNSGAPLDYVLCEKVSNGTEFFQWQFTSYHNPKSFEIQLAHEFSDPVHYPPPYNYVEYFAPLVANLACFDTAGMNCVLPGASSPLHAVIDAISN